MAVGFRLKEILRKKGMTIKELAEVSKISVNTLYSITKRDSENIDKVIEVKIANALNVPVSALHDDTLQSFDDPKDLEKALNEQRTGMETKTTYYADGRIENTVIDPSLDRIQAAVDQMNEKGRNLAADAVEAIAGNPEYHK